MERHEAIKAIGELQAKLLADDLALLRHVVKHPHSIHLPDLQTDAAKRIGEQYNRAVADACSAIEAIMEAEAGQ